MDISALIFINYVIFYAVILRTGVPFHNTLSSGRLNYFFFNLASLLVCFCDYLITILTKVIAIYTGVSYMK